MAEATSRGPTLRSALSDAACVLAALTAAKAIAGVPYVGAAALTAAAYVQIYLPMRSCERQRLPYAAIGLRRAGARRALADAAALAACVLPVYLVGLHVLLTHGGDALRAAHLPELARHLPAARLGPAWPGEPAAWLALARRALDAAATHYLGVALPEEVFYRGYLQRVLARRMGPGRRIAGGRLGLAAVLSCALFALGHFLGEWHPARLLPFFPGLLFAWLRSRSGSIVGCVALHGTCNVVSAGALWLYRAG